MTVSIYHSDRMVDAVPPLLLQVVNARNSAYSHRDNHLDNFDSAVRFMAAACFGTGAVADLRADLQRANDAMQRLEGNAKDDFSRLRQELAGQNQAFKLEVAASLKQLNDSVLQQLTLSRSSSAEHMDRLSVAIQLKLDSFSGEANQKIELLRKGVGDSGSHLQAQVGLELEKVRHELSQATQQSRGELTTSLRNVSESLGASSTNLIAAQKVQMDEIRNAMETRLNVLNADNEKRLEQMRQTVDEKLQGTLETRLGESFKQVSERLEQVHKGLGEMQALASGVGDLKRVLTNVKTRGTWGEVQLGSLLDQILTVEQFEKNVNTTGTNERVEFAIKLPGGTNGKPCWLPVDAKFPVEDYQRILEASENGDAAAVESACRRLEITLRLCAKSISEKYLLPPRTTDFGILFLATEGLYAEALRRAGLAEALQHEYRVILTGPSTFAAILNSLRMGFQTLTIQQRSGEVWERLGIVKTQFSKYAGVLAKVRKKLQEATNTVDLAERRTRVLQSELRHVECAPGAKPPLLTDAAIWEDEEISLAVGDAY
jgi:DNA recombination protein RmuC